MRILLLIIILFFPGLAGAAQVYQPGFRTVGIWEGEPRLRLDINIWYPALRKPKDLNYPPWVISGSANAKPAEGKFPLLLISHASSADRFAYHTLAAWLACEGFVVAAPTHRGDNMDNMDDLFSWTQLSRRAQELGLAIRLALSEKDIAHCVDAKRIGLIGFGSGATVGLLMGGALPVCTSWSGYCQKAGENDPYCSPWARDRINSLCQFFPLRESLANPAIKAIAAIAPGFGMIFDAESFTSFYPPLLLVVAGKDRFNHVQLHCEPIAKFLGSKARILDLPEADAGALISECPSGLADDLPELCRSMDSGVRERIQAILKETLLAFFSNYLVVTANLPQIPDPPDLAPKAEPAPETSNTIKKVEKKR